MAATSSAFPMPPSHHTDHCVSSNKQPSLFTLSPPPNPTLKTPTIRSRLSKLCQQGQPHVARQLFDTIPRPTTVLWNTIVIGFICNNMPLEALLFYSHLKNSSPHTQCDSYTYSSTLKACADTGDLMAGKAIHAHFIRGLTYPSRIVYNSLLNMYSTCLCNMGCLDFSKYDVVHKVVKTMRKRDVVAWNTMISWYVKTERYVEAVRQFRVMMKWGIKPSPVSFVNVFPAISSVGDYETANVLYGMLLKLGNEYANDMFVVSSAISMYADLGCIDISKKVFDTCLEKNTEVWNTMIGGYMQHNYFFQGVDLFLQAVETEQTVLDDVTFLLALTAISQLQCLDLVQQMHAFVIKNLKVLPVTVLNAIIVMYSRCNAVQASFKVFDKMAERDIVSWNTMISGLIQNGLDDEGVMLVYEMQKQGFTIDYVTVTSLLSAASNLRNKEIGKQTHAYLLRHCIQFDGMDNYLIDMYAKSGSIRMSECIFEKNDVQGRDQATWNAMISGYTQNVLIEQAFVTFRQMLEKNLRPNAVTLASMLRACSSLGSIDLGKQIHGASIRYLLDQNIFVRTALVDMYSKSGAIKYAETVFIQSSEKTSVTYTTMISGYGQHGMGNRALSLFHSMNKSGIQPDAITFVAVLSACSYAGLVDEGLQIFESMKRDFKIQPSTEHYCCVTDMLGRVGRVFEAYEFVKQLGEDGNVMEVWGSLLGACRLHGHIDLGEKVATRLLDLHKLDRMAGYHVLLSNMYAEDANWENVNKLRKEMREKGMQKQVGSSWLYIGGRAVRFVSNDNDHPQCDEIYTLLERLTMEIKDNHHSTCPRSLFNIR
ncbi:pentatricopeptide repeat-containing protein At3g22150, chloroplastic [Mercurialis annua]|uniref:pentatricopeptide repeat-containing protein At3g22150, chloroplastic n=1 Tax=Mercurialis annua TaxID=3986 RepID=UPI00216076E7|nr:pentatricopeptide repeat-containing protein At3g22150, chloroplastic [Mercurialis annua]XP_050230829.1 pentatricopeptide repeat-containing protein At3g22150, chloroplastic [Mercurialis annua]XP_050230830.1 pentatricopeptide repeat-containing protein At3g22150, chloroplastic [Mercurialis annua]XP_050230831.1 pentatricopeptide repeat-containing protein At3g22150, chloroplastic [Mercurialis annua]XP_055961661.1 pentatricopeptide repeat-containing protein At3g22150, chloroplastic [Mercurialis an